MGQLQGFNIPSTLKRVRTQNDIGFSHNEQSSYTAQPHVTTIYVTKHGSNHPYMDVLNPHFRNSTYATTTNSLPNSYTHLSGISTVSNYSLERWTHS